MDVLIEGLIILIIILFLILITFIKYKRSNKNFKFVSFVIIHLIAVSLILLTNATFNSNILDKTPVYKVSRIVLYKDKGIIAEYNSHTIKAPEVPNYYGLSKTGHNYVQDEYNLGIRVKRTLYVTKPLYVYIKKCERHRWYNLFYFFILS